MIYQLILGSFITLASLICGVLVWWAMDRLIAAMEPWLRRPTFPAKPLLAIMLIILSAMTMVTLGVWLWAFVFTWADVFGTLEEAFYYSLIAYTTLGLGDVLVPTEYRLLGGMTGANGFLMFGLMTAALTDSLRYVRDLEL
ncbi:ion channel [Ruegeria arenilitoris]|uniref:ion channel n=1 Tax=Ruegeria arenilitoris TaxID=1173585 RepID=UPI00147DE7B1|nr:ion channel [Ruegeria arenilitoris]MBY6082770.1 two pore domain potassium channel family protein [Ruegeria arenilitoris]